MFSYVFERNCVLRQFSVLGWWQWSLFQPHRCTLDSTVCNFLLVCQLSLCFSLIHLWFDLDSPMHIGVNLGSFQSPNATQIQMGVPSLRKRCPFEHIMYTHGMHDIKSFIFLLPFPSVSSTFDALYLHSIHICKVAPKCTIVVHGVGFWLCSICPWAYQPMLDWYTCECMGIILRYSSSIMVLKNHLHAGIEIVISHKYWIIFANGYLKVRESFVVLEYISQVNIISTSYSY